MRGAVHHIDLTVIDLAASSPFYDRVLGFLSYRRTRDDDVGPNWELRDNGRLVCEVDIRPARAAGRGGRANSRRPDRISALWPDTTPSSSPIPTDSSLSSCIGRETAKMMGC
jgi:hypothetical protein